MAMSLPDTGPSLRRYFVNTMFDACFVILGIIIGSALSTHASKELVLTTILTSSVALAISTGSSVYEAERTEQSRRMDEISRAMLSRVHDTNLGRSSRASIALIAIVNSLAPLLAGALALIPFIFMPSDSITAAAEIGIGIVIGLLFVTGFIMGRISERNPWIKGSRMAVIGLAAFFVCYLIGGAV
jgi:predicted membrane protein (TIGR00267 family)